MEDRVGARVWSMDKRVRRRWGTGGTGADLVSRARRRCPRQMSGLWKRPAYLSPAGTSQFQTE